MTTKITARSRNAPCDSPLLYAADNLSLYHAFEEPSEGQEHHHADLQIALPLGGPTYAAWQTPHGEQRRQTVPPGSLLITASRQPHAIQIREKTEIAVVWLPAPFVAQTALELTNGVSTEIHAANAVQDGLLQHLCLSLLTEVRQSRSPARLYVDAMANLLAAHLIRHHFSGTMTPGKTGGLSPRTLRRVTDYIWEHLDQDVSLADLASIARLSESRFAFVFRHSTGQSPYQYVLTQRIEHAKDLLRESRLSIGEISLQVGFCDQSQLTRQFKKHVGVTPKAFLSHFQH